MHRLWPVCWTCHKGGMERWTHGALSDPMKPWATPWSPVTDWFTFHPFPATDKNECLNTTLCPLTATCRNTQGSYFCVCNPGFETPEGRTQFTGSRGTCIGKQILWRLPVKISLEKELTKTNNASVQILLPYANNLSIPQYLSTVIWYSCLCVHNMYVCVSVASASSVLCHPMDCSPPGCSVHGILQAIMLEWIAIPFSNRSPLGHKLSDGDGIVPSSYLEPHWFFHPPISFTRKAEQNFSSHRPSPFITSRELITWK